MDADSSLLEVINQLQRIADNTATDNTSIVISIVASLISIVGLSISLLTVYNAYPHLLLVAPVDSSDVFSSFYMDSVDERSLDKYNAVIFVAVTNRSSIPAYVHNASLSVRGFRTTNISSVLTSPPNNYFVNDFPRMKVFPEKYINISKLSLPFPFSLAPHEAKTGFIYFPFCDDYGGTVSVKLTLFFGRSSLSRRLTLYRNPTNFTQCRGKNKKCTSHSTNPIQPPDQSDQKAAYPGSFYVKYATKEHPK